MDEVHGYKFEHMFAPGPHRLLVRVHTIDQLTINLRLRTPNQADSEASLDRYLYGFLYGFIASLAAYNLMLFAGLRKRVYLLYALYLLSFLLLNLAYTGRGAVWLWGEWVSVQRFSIVSLIVLMPSLGLLFSRAFLELPQLAPGLDRWLRLFTWIGPALLLVTMITGAYEAAVWLAFVVLGLFIFSMVGLGVHAVRRGQPAAQFFLLGAICSMVGTALTEFSVWGFIPYSVWAYRGIEIGMMLDGTLLALALAKYVRGDPAPGSRNYQGAIAEGQCGSGSARCSAYGRSRKYVAPVGAFTPGTGTQRGSCYPEHDDCEPVARTGHTTWQQLDGGEHCCRRHATIRD
ncbi:MAG: 7TM-DISM domain-containing protein [Rhodocyclaceae bacterium]|nr:7TM-DISM domain-containing protein [Rhodocyclaceae bacterium]